MEAYYFQLFWDETFKLQNLKYQRFQILIKSDKKWIKSKVDLQLLFEVKIQLLL